MKELTLKRIETGDTGTFGLLDVDGEIFHTGELPWRDNARGKSSIPPGTYNMSVVNSPKFGRVYGVHDVENRSHILFHAGNVCGDEDLGFKADSDGCVLLGIKRAVIEGQPAVTLSKKALERFMDMMAGEDAILHVIEEYPEAGDVSQQPVG